MWKSATSKLYDGRGETSFSMALTTIQSTATPQLASAEPSFAHAPKWVPAAGDDRSAVRFEFDELHWGTDGRLVYDFVGEFAGLRVLCEDHVAGSDLSNGHQTTIGPDRSAGPQAILFPLPWIIVSFDPWIDDYRAGRELIDHRASADHANAVTAWSCCRIMDFAARLESNSSSLLPSIKASLDPSCDHAKAATMA